MAGSAFIGAFGVLAVGVLLLPGCTRPGVVAASTEIVSQPIVFDATLWHAARDTLASLPDDSADPLAGRLVTGWAVPHGGNYQRRFRVTVGLNYEADYAHSVIVTVERQRLDAGARWLDDGTDDNAASALAAAIEAHAGELRLSENHPS